jgi:hypothetical protein
VAGVELLVVRAAEPEPGVQHSRGGRPEPPVGHLELRQLGRVEDLALAHHEAEVLAGRDEGRDHLGAEHAQQRVDVDLDVPIPFIAQPNTPTRNLRRAHHRVGGALRPVDPLL